MPLNYSTISFKQNDKTIDYTKSISDINKEKYKSLFNNTINITPTGSNTILNLSSYFLKIDNHNSYKQVYIIENDNTTNMPQFISCYNELYKHIIKSNLHIKELEQIYKYIENNKLSDIKDNNGVILIN